MQTALKYSQVMKVPQYLPYEQVPILHNKKFKTVFSEKTDPPYPKWCSVLSRQPRVTVT